MGDVRLWDIAGGLPLLSRHGYDVTQLHAKERRPLGLEVSSDRYDLEFSTPDAWKVRGGILVCPEEYHQRLRQAYELI
jgi:hypothetical protein